MGASTPLSHRFLAVKFLCALSPKISAQLSHNPRNPCSGYYLLQHASRWREILHDAFADISGRGGLWAFKSPSRQTPWFRMTGAEKLTSDL
jgi:hypothetical protein